jgi:uncharacterized delta-60 repeat protein
MKPLHLFLLCSFPSAITLNAQDGTLDPTFDGDGIAITDLGSSPQEGRGVTVQADGKVVVVGNTYGTFSDAIALRYQSNGLLDPTFNGTGHVTSDLFGGEDGMKAVAVQADGKIVAAGFSNDGNDGITLWRYNSNGTLDSGFDGDGHNTIHMGSIGCGAQGITFQPDGKILVASQSWGPTGWVFTLLRFNTNGTLDNTFSGDGKLTTDLPTPHEISYAVAVQSDGKIVLVGEANTVPLPISPRCAIRRPARSTTPSAVATAS